MHSIGIVNNSNNGLIQKQSSFFVFQFTRTAEKTTKSRTKKASNMPDMKRNKMHVTTRRSQKLQL